MMDASSPPSNNHLGVDAWITRLPTPALSDSAGFVSPPVSRMPSSLSINSLSSDHPYKHLKPLPSPIQSRRKDQESGSSDDDDPGNTASPGSTAGSISSKTNAFFSSPFAIAIPRSNESTPSRSSSLAIPKRKQAHDVFGGGVDNPTSPNSAQFPASPPKARVVSDSSAPTSNPPSRAQTANSSFFYSPPVAGLTPAPPPPLPVVPIPTQKPKSSAFPSISRFFPSRNSAKAPNAATDIDYMDPNVAADPEPRRPSFEGLSRSPPSLRHEFFDFRAQQHARELEGRQMASSYGSSHGFGSLASSPPTHSRLTAGADIIRLEVPSPVKSVPQPPKPIRRETQPSQLPTPTPQSGDVVGAPDTPLTLIKLLGQGAFSSVWLASDQTGELGLSRTASIGRAGSTKRKGRRGASREAAVRNAAKEDGLTRQGSAGKRVVGRRRQSQSVAKKDRDVKLGGLTPPTIDEHDLESTAPVLSSRASGEGLLTVDDHAQETSMSRSKSTNSLRWKEREPGRLLAVKMMDRALCDSNDRTRISFVREVEVLRHISHPSIVSYLHSFTTPTHHCLILEHVAGGELFDLTNNDQKHSRMTEPLLRRMWSELCRAVAWMHSVALVHRDIKLENILLTCDPFESQYAHPEDPDTPSLDLLPSPLLKLSDFGLSRFIDPASPLLTTRCGSESYAAPEIVMGTKYDGRQTDAWACGVVLFALATRALPFDRTSLTGRTSVREASVGGSDHGGSVNGSVMSGRGDENPGKERRSYLIRIAKNEWIWPVNDTPAKLTTPALKKVVERLLTRDTKRRAKILDLWDEEWMTGPGSLPKPGEGFKINIDEEEIQIPLSTAEIHHHEIPPPSPTTLLDPTHEDSEATLQGGNETETETEVELDAEDDEVDDDVNCDGVFVNGDKIAHIARLDVN